MKPAILLLITLSLLMLSCKQAAKPEAEVKEEPKVVYYKYPSLSNQELTELYAKTDKMDMLFYDLPFSINQDDAKSAKNTVLYVSPAPVEINESCKALGRLSWISDGKIIREADMYMDSVCHFFLFMTNNQPMAANAMSESGIQFFTKVFDQVQQKTK